MNYASLEDLGPGVDATARSILGTTITYFIGSRALSIKAHGNFEDGTINVGSSVGIKQEVELMVLKTDLPASPASAHRIRTARRPGEIFQPVNIRTDDTGRHWMFELKKVAA